ncbi:hypothetical protein NA57DRAFT_47577, partial [Rhizodiscina lignyota]
QLVKRLYQPGNPALLTSIEKHLQWWQRSKDGWPMANTMLQTADPNVRFFGALTYVVKLNMEGSKINHQGMQTLSQQLVAWAARLCEDKKSICQKLSTALAICYLQPEASADDCLGILATALHTGKIVDSLSAEALSVDAVLPNLKPAQLLMLVRFCRALAEEGLSRLRSDDKKAAARSQDQMESNLLSAVQVIGFAIRFSGDHKGLIQNLAVDSFVKWAPFSIMGSTPLESCDKVRELLPSVLICISEWEEPEISEVGEPLDLMSELLTSHPIFFRPADLREVAELICSPFGQARIAAAHDEADRAFIQFLVAYGDVETAKIATSVNDPLVEQFLEMMHNLLRFEGYAAVDDDVILEAQQFWAGYIDFVLDSMEDEKRRDWQGWGACTKGHITRMVEELWVKIQYPPSVEYDAWNMEEKKSFGQFRVDIRDILQAAYRVLGSDLLQAFVRIALSSTAERNWIQVEAALYGLNAVAECLNERELRDDAIGNLFNSSLYPMLSGDDPVPYFLRRTAMNTIGQYDSYFEHHPENLPGILNFLFKSLEGKSIADIAAKSIWSLCKACRGSLTPELNTFFQQYQNFLGWETAKNFTKEKVIGAVAAIAQALPADAEKNGALNHLLDFVSADVKTSLEQAAAGETDLGHNTAIDAMLCLASIAKSFQESMEVVDLDGDGVTQSYWDTGAGAATQQHIIQMLSTMMEVWPDSGSVLEPICATLRAGYIETSPGPFVLPPSATVGLLTRTNITTKLIEQVLHTECAFLRAHTMKTSKYIEKEAEAVLNHVISMIRDLGEPRNDPELAQSLVDVLVRYIPRYTPVLANLQPQEALEVALQFTIQCLKAPEPLPKRSASNFWNTFLAQTSQPQPLQQSLDMIATHFGPLLATTLTAQVGGICMRSDVEFLAEPLKKLYGRHTRAKAWFYDALMLSNEAANLSQREIAEAELEMVARMPVEERKMFVRTLGLTVDLGTVRRVCGEFWQRARTAAYQPDIAEPDVPVYLD